MIKLPLKLLVLLLAVASAGVIWQRTELTAMALAQTDPLPESRQLVAEGRYAEAADYLGFFMEYDYVRDNAEARQLFQDIETVRASWDYRADKFSEGLLTGTSDEALGMAAGVVTDFFVIGDVRDLIAQGTNYLQGEETDEVLIALASLGLSLSAAQMLSTGGTVASGGLAAPAMVGTTAAKSGVITLKAARKLNKLPPWLAKSLVAGSKNAEETTSLGKMADIFRDTSQLANTRGGLNLLSKTTDAKSLRRMSRFAKTFGDHSNTLYRIGGDVAVDMAPKAPQLGKGNIKLAATYGREGLVTLNKLGAPKFLKLTRASKILYKGDALRLALGYMLQLPLWIHVAVLALATLLWLPRPRRRKPALREQAA